VQGAATRLSTGPWAAARSTSTGVQGVLGFRCLRTDGGPVPRRCAPHAGCDVPSGNLAAPSGHVAQRPSRSVGIRGRAGFPADHRPAAARRPSPLPSCRFPFPVRLQGVPTDACRRVSEPASASPPSRRVRRARRGAEPPGARDPRERGPADLAWSCLPRTRSFEVPSSGLPAAVHSRHTPRRHERVVTTGNEPSGHGCQATASCSVHVVSHHLDGFLRTAGSGLVASRYRTWGSLRFTSTKRRKPKFPGGWQDGSVPEGEGVGPDPRSADPSKV
jgi:hypothetical protein